MNRFGVDDYVRFTEGDCHYLARALHVRTGWPLYAFAQEHGGPVTHAFVRAPNKRFLDIDGLSTGSELKKRWVEDGLREFSWERLRGYFGPVDFGKYTYERAAIIAERLLQRPDVQKLL